MPDEISAQLATLAPGRHVAVRRDGRNIGLWMWDPISGCHRQWTMKQLEGLLYRGAYEYAMSRPVVNL